MRTNDQTASNMTDRYVYAVIKHLPRSQRADIEQELRGLIEDMLAEKAGENAPTRGNVIDVLTELGRPDLFAARYQDSSRCLIGPEYFEEYALLLKIVLAATAFGMTLATFIGALTSPPTNGWLAAAGFVGTVVSALFQGFAGVTLTFVIIQRCDKRSQHERAADWNPDSLPELPPAPQQSIKRWEPVSAVVFTLLVMVLFNFTPQLLGVFSFTDRLQVVPLFDLAALRRALPLLNLAFVLGIAREIFRFLEGRYTPRLAAATVALNAAGALLMLSVFGGGRVWNPALLRQLTALYGPGAFEGIGLQLFTLLPNLFVGVVLFALLLDTGVTAYRAWHSHGSEPAAL